MSEFTLYLAGDKKLRAKRTLVMGILNATPDSFSDGGEINDKSALQKRIKEIIKSGADILDVGGESTRPGHEKVDENEEIRRVLPAIQAIRKLSDSIPISIDTSKAAVAEAALNAGASLINDVSALSDSQMAQVAQNFGCSIILMRGQPTGKNPVAGCKKQFQAIVKNAKKQGIKPDRILLDPGLGFGDLKTADYSVSPGSDPVANIQLILNINKYSLGLPVVIGASRKRFIGDLTGVENPKDRLAGSIMAAIMAQQAGAAIIRAHDIPQTVQALKNLI